MAPARLNPNDSLALTFCRISRLAWPVGIEVCQFASRSVRTTVASSTQTVILASFTSSRSSDTQPSCRLILSSDAKELSTYSDSALVFRHKRNNLPFQTPPSSIWRPPLREQYLLLALMSFAYLISGMLVRSLDQIPRRRFNGPSTTLVKRCGLPRPICPLPVSRPARQHLPQRGPWDSRIGNRLSHRRTRPGRNDLSKLQNTARRGKYWRLCSLL